MLPTVYRPVSPKGYTLSPPIDNILGMNKETNFNDYLTYLRESVGELALYWQKIGKDNPHIKDITAGLNHQDPFIIYKASIAATMLLGDRSIYH